jgi:S-adenosylmethionine:tRNA ribosyltransferase-isomerase
VHVRTADFDFQLPRELIAQSPADPRDSSRLLYLDRRTGAVAHHHFRDLPQLLRPGDLLVVNDTRVMAARLFGRRDDTGGIVEVLLLSHRDDGDWDVMIRPARQAVSGRKFTFAANDGPLAATVRARLDDGTVALEFGRDFDAATVGQVPLPPYIESYRGDPERYQTVYSDEPASAAAPTAGLHFTPRLLDLLAAMGVERTAVTLHVGPGTFKPVTVDDPHDHVLHEEFVRVGSETAATIRAAREAGRRVIAVGTTVVRTLEHVARQYGRVEPYSGPTSLRILPGDDFRVIDGLITNFHLPRSTLIMLVATFAGTDAVLDAYAEAIRERYRFYSFGDAMLIV